MARKPLHVQKLSYDTLGDLNDGLLKHTVQEGLDRVLSDLLGRRKLDKARQLEIKITFKPVLDDKGFIEDTVITTAVKVSTPPAQLATRAMLADEDGEEQLVFKSAVPEDPRQGHLSETVKEGGEDRGE